ncbi:hypothetical protein WM41_1125 [Corynebacterium simulans]|uniref:Uncharacterized protein n=1 Tax=Corynebacterium simulans TaxID=146827 RepID=A0ABR5V9U0_9CORY|nr:hypothetical protein WM41_1125 [Corynebacterium simulans]
MGHVGAGIGIWNREYVKRIDFSASVGKFTNSSDRPVMKTTGI